MHGSATPRDAPLPPRHVPHFLPSPPHPRAFLCLPPEQAPREREKGVCALRVGTSAHLWMDRGARRAAAGGGGPAGARRSACASAGRQHRTHAWPAGRPTLESAGASPSASPRLPPLDLSSNHPAPCCPLRLFLRLHAEESLPEAFHVRNGDGESYRYSGWQIHSLNSVFAPHSGLSITCSGSDDSGARHTARFPCPIPLCPSRNTLNSPVGRRPEESHVAGATGGWMQPARWLYSSPARPLPAGGYRRDG